jgi:colanic acid biosynthesis glycosyl transferase WcaI
VRVLFVNQYFPPDASATAYLLGELAEDMARHHEVWVLAGRPSYSPETSRFQPRGVHVARVPSAAFHRRSMLGRVANYGTFAACALLRGVALPRPDLVVAMTDPPFIGPVGLAIARRHRAAFIQAYPDLFPDVAVALGRMDHPLVVGAWRRMNEVVRRKAARIVVVGRDMRDRVIAQGVPAGRVAFLPNWASDHPVDLELVARLRKEHGWSDRLVVMHAGNQGLAQNLDTLMDAAERLRGSEVLFVFLGDGAALPHLRQRANTRGLDDVVFLEQLPKDAALPLLAAADLHAISLAPGLAGTAVPSKLYGILALGIPFVAAVEPKSEVARVVEETGAGLRVDPGDGAGFAEAVRRFAAGEVDASALGAAGRAAFERTYERGVATRAYREVLETVASAG